MIVSCYRCSFSSTYFLSFFCLSCLLVFYNEEHGVELEDGWLMLLPMEYGNTHLVTGDLQTLSGSSVTLKRKTKVHVRNQQANRAAISLHPTLHKQPIARVHI